MTLAAAGERLREMRLPIPVPGPGQVQIRVEACGVCRTDLHVVDGELAHPKLPLVPGHQIVGTVSVLGEGVSRPAIGERVGVPWLGGSCGGCRFCVDGRENLCAAARYTGYQLDGGFAEYCTAQADFCLSVPEGFSSLHAAPLLCAGLIGYRAWRPCAEARELGLYGFGAAAHILVQLAQTRGQAVYALTRPGDTVAQDFARELGACWAGDSSTPPPVELDAAIIFAPDGALVPRALGAVRRGGIVVCAGIHMSDIPSFQYALLWGERELRSVANLTRRDGAEFLPLAAGIPVRTEVVPYALEEANQALDDLREGRLRGAAVVIP
jgi:propanol-preferring alcohol dehydrogenase